VGSTDEPRGGADRTQSLCLRRQCGCATKGSDRGRAPIRVGVIELPRWGAPWRRRTGCVGGDSGDSGVAAMHSGCALTTWLDAISILLRAARPRRRRRWLVTIKRVCAAQRPVWTDISSRLALAGLIQQLPFSCLAPGLPASRLRRSLRLLNPGEGASPPRRHRPTTGQRAKLDFAFRTTKGVVS